MTLRQVPRAADGTLGLSLNAFNVTLAVQSGALSAGVRVWDRVLAVDTRALGAFLCFLFVGNLFVFVCLILYSLLWTAAFSAPFSLHSLFAARLCFVLRFVLCFVLCFVQCWFCAAVCSVRPACAKLTRKWCLSLRAIRHAVAGGSDA